jgi:hypothetical protein
LLNQLDGRVLRQAVGWPRGHSAVDEHTAGQDQRLGSFARLDQPALDQEQV